MNQADASIGATGGEVATAEHAARLARADTLIKDHMLLGLGVGLIPAPLFDLAAAMGLQLLLLNRLTSLYGVRFSENAARGVVLSLLGGAGTGAVATGLFFSAMKFIPGAGTVFGVVSMPVAIAAVTYALGKVFVAHLEVGGTLADFDGKRQRPYFRDLMQRGRRAAEALAQPTEAR